MARASEQAMQEMSTARARERAKVMRQEIENAFADIVRKHPELASDLKLKKTIRFDLDGFKASIECTWAGGRSRDASLYDAMAYEGSGLPPRGTTFLSAKKEFTITGMRKGGRITTTGSDGKVWLFKQEDVKRLLATNKLVGTFKINLPEG